MSDYALFVGSAVVSAVVNALGRLRGPRRAGPERILVVKLDHLGDVITATPVFRALKEARPEAEIEALVGTWSREALIGNPFIARVHVYDAKRFQRRGTPAPGAWGVIRALARRRYNTVVELRGDAWTLVLPFLCGATRRHDRGRVRLRDWLARRTAATGRSRPALHEVDTNMEVVRPLVTRRAAGVPRVEVFVEEAERARLRVRLRELGVELRGPLVCVHPGAGWRPRTWRPERYARIADWVREHYDVQVAFVGSDDERDIESAIRRATRGASHVTLFGALTLRETITLLSLSTLVVGNDSGLVHAAAACGVPVVALFGPQDPRRFRPWSADAAVLHHPVPCFPCQQVTCARPELPCVNLIEIEEVVPEMERALAGRVARR